MSRTAHRSLRVAGLAIACGALLATAAAGESAPKLTLTPSCFSDSARLNIDLSGLPPRETVRLAVRWAHGTREGPFGVPGGIDYSTDADGSLSIWIGHGRPAPPYDYTVTATWAGHTLEQTAPLACDGAIRVENLSITPEAFRAERAPTPLIGKAGGATVNLTLPFDATVHFRVRRDPPRARHGPPPASPHVFRRTLPPGQTPIAFTGTLGHRTLDPGRYLMIVRARDIGGIASARQRVRFRILP